MTDAVISVSWTMSGGGISCNAACARNLGSEYTCSPSGIISINTQDAMNALVATVYNGGVNWCFSFRTDDCPAGWENNVPFIAANPSFTEYLNHECFYCPNSVISTDPNVGTCTQGNYPDSQGSSRNRFCACVRESVSPSLITSAAPTAMPTTRTYYPVCRDQHCNREVYLCEMYYSLSIAYLATPQ